MPEAQGVQAWDRYAGVNNNPVRFNDPTGHGIDCFVGELECKEGIHSSDDNTPSLTEITKTETEDAPIVSQTEEADESDSCTADKTAENDNPDHQCNLVKLIIGGVLIGIGAAGFYIGFNATAEAAVALQVELVPLAALSTVAMGLVAFGGIRIVINSGCIPET